MAFQYKFGSIEMKSSLVEIVLLHRRIFQALIEIFRDCFQSSYNQVRQINVKMGRCFDIFFWLELFRMHQSVVG